jgi:hypothetical protein
VESIEYHISSMAGKYFIKISGELFFLLTMQKAGKSVTPILTIFVLLNIQEIYITYTT